MPSYRGGLASLLKFIGENFNYPPIEKSIAIKGRVFLSFWVLEDGSVGEVKVIRSLTPEFDKEAIRVIKLTSGEWEPARQNGKPVKTLLNLPVNVILR
jgi:TonB family protein